jgi:3-methylcrotonyl-CoA carboxylase alpha subunit
VSAHGTANLEAPMSGTIVKVLVEEGQAVAAGEALMVLEAMKMEHTITAPSAGTVSRIHFRAGQLAPGGAMLIEIV